MNTYIFLYPETSFFEVNLAAYFMKTKGNVYIVAEDEHQSICTNEGIRIQQDISLSQTQAEYPETTCVLDNIVLSPGNEYVDFALAVGKAADIFADEADYQETVDYFKYFKYI